MTAEELFHNPEVELIVSLGYGDGAGFGAGNGDGCGGGDGSALLLDGRLLGAQAPSDLSGYVAYDEPIGCVVYGAVPFGRNYAGVL